MDKKIIPLLFGADLNCYNVARAFHEAYGVVSHAFGRYGIGATLDTKIVKFTAIENVDTDEVLVKTANDFAAAHSEYSVIVMGCTDNYVSIIARNKDKFAANCIAPYSDPDLINDITLKDHFYALCDKYDIPHPKTFVYSNGDSIDDLGFDYPIIVKASNSVEYFKHNFEGMKKVYRSYSKEETQKILDDIYNAGYKGTVILQDTIPGDDSRMYVLTSYSDKDANVRMMCLGHVLLEEHSPKGIGNHCAIITEENLPLMKRFKKLLEEIHFVGFSNFDIKYDERNDEFVAFEINVRQGRSNYYVTASGNNIAKCVVEDRVLDVPFSDTTFNANQIYWRYIPDSVVYWYVSDEIKNKIKELKKSKKAYSSMRYAYDFKNHLKRRLYVMVHEYHQKQRFIKYYPRKKR